MNRNGDRNVGGIERWLSGLVGGAMTSLGLRRRGWRGAAYAGAGGALLWRGLSGRSRLYRRLGLSTHNPGYRRSEVRRSITIQASEDAIRRVWRERDVQLHVFDRLESVEPAGESAWQWTLREAGGLVHCVAEIVAKSDDELGFCSTADSDLTFDGEVRLRPAVGHDGTELSICMHVSPPGGRAAKAMEPLLYRLFRHRFGEEMTRLKQYLETGEIATSAMSAAERRRRLEEPARKAAAGTADVEARRGWQRHEPEGIRP